MTTRISQPMITFAVALVVVLAGAALPQAASAHSGPHEDRGLNGIQNHQHEDAIHPKSVRRYGKITAHWNHKKGIYGYHLCLAPKHVKCGDHGSTRVYHEMEGSSASYTFTELDNDVEYRFERKADLRGAGIATLYVQPLFPPHKPTKVELIEAEKEKNKKLTELQKRKDELRRISNASGNRYAKVSARVRELKKEIKTARAAGDYETAYKLERELKKQEYQKQRENYLRNRDYRRWRDFKVEVE